MGDIMRSVPFESLIYRIFDEYRQKKTIFGIHEDQFFIPEKNHCIEVFGQRCATPLGPAAGPHTQLAQNIVAGYLSGGRFIELKTVQQLDTLEIDKPCIYAADEAYNVEWSTEYTLEKALAEYIKAWIILHLLDFLLFDENPKNPSFIFNMSVGYSFEGIKSPKMDTFINSLIDASKAEIFKESIETLEVIIKEGTFLTDTRWESKLKKLKNFADFINSKICKSVTLSTMHGCPPQEIEAICSYMLKEKKLNTYVKLNPTLLGYKKVREILDKLGYTYITLKEDSFKNDLQYSDALAMLHRLTGLAKENSLGFGVKLTNTLGTVNDQENLPGEEMYMSGRSLFPLTTNVASLLSKEFGGKLPISYSGGVTAATVLEVFETGIRPITLATDLLKPGGYARLRELAQILKERASAWDKKDIEVLKIESLANLSLENKFLHKDFRGTDLVKISGSLPMVDCYIAPCVQSCPIHQNIPDYIYLVGIGEYAQALDVIYETNALPNLTGYICDHQCQYVCTRLDYEGSVQIREMKKIAAEQGFSEYIKTWQKEDATEIKAAVVGCGPGGLSAAYFLARAAFDVTVFEKEKDAGGITKNVIPEFRFPESALQADIDFIKKHGVKFNFGVDNKILKVDALKKAGYNYIFYAIGAEIDNELAIENKNIQVTTALPFLKAFRKKDKNLNLGEKVVVVGGGNTAMDGARAAIRCKGVKEVTVIYRRSEKEMPADREEYLNALEDGVKFLFLTNPESVDDDNKLICNKMELGELDSSGRRRPIKSDKTVALEADTIISAIGERVDDKQLNYFGLPVDERKRALVDETTLETPVKGVYVIGDAQSGPSTVVKCIASARVAVESAIDSELKKYESEFPHEEHHHDEEEISESLSEIKQLEDHFFDSIRVKKGRFILPADTSCDFKTFAEIEASRCLECNYICDKCVEVCPNRANVAIDMRHRDDLFANPFQIIHIDAFCNECGNCSTFCPWEGSPYLDKFTLFNRLDDFEDSKNNGFFLDQETLYLRLNNEVSELSILADGSFEKEIDEEISAIIEEIVTNHSYLLDTVDE
ncbi:MAG: putative selenate reductase subunit YgfK [Sphaerochaetaceae bacterium]